MTQPDRKSTYTDGIKAAILDKITQLRSGVSFVELQDIPGFTGELSIILEGEDVANIVLWPGISKEASIAIRELLREGKITFSQTSVLTYAIDGVLCSLPLATRARAYKRPRWLPVTFSPARQAK